MEKVRNRQGTSKETARKSKEKAKKSEEKARKR